MDKLLLTINSPDDLKRLSHNDLGQLAGEIREAVAWLRVHPEDQSLNPKLDATADHKAGVPACAYDRPARVEHRQLVVADGSDLEPHECAGSGLRTRRVRGPVRAVPVARAWSRGVGASQELSLC